MSLTVGSVDSQNQYSSKIAFGSKVPTFAKFKVVHPDAWSRYVGSSKGGFYGDGIISYAARWAKMMEQAMKKGAKLEDIAEELGNKADTQGISGYMYGKAVKILSDVWKHGKALKNWHNASFGVEKGAKGVVNPTIISIG